MRPKKYQATRVAQFLVAAAFILTAVLLPTVNRAAGQILLGINVLPAAPTIEVNQSTQFTATAVFNDGSSQPVSGPTGTWVSAGSMATPRYYHTATRLPDGSVLVAGGYGSANSLATAERYNPATGLWTPAGTMSIARTAHTATLLPDGTVLVVGGINFATNALTNTTEIYNPLTNTWSAGPPLTLGLRAFHSAVALDTGDVMVVAGMKGWPDCTYRTNAEIYNWISDTWQATGALDLARSNAATTLLADGSVLLAGGPSNNCPTPNNGLNEAEIYDPASGLWSVLPNLSTTRYNHFIATMPNGKVLLAGGTTAGGQTATADVYNPATGTFSLTTPMATARGTSGGTGDNGATVVLPDGRVLVAGGHNGAGVLSSAELFNPSTSTWSATGSLLTARTHNTITSLGNGLVLVVGGHAAGAVPLGSAEIYQPQIAWSSSNPAVATIDQNGFATSVALGTTTISAASGSIIGSTTLTVAKDELPPATTAAYAAPNANGWHSTDVIVQLNATDSGGPVSASGVQSITYSLSGAQSGGGTVNGASVSFAVSNEGTSTVSYHAVDNDGNVEPTSSFTIKIDKAPFDDPNANTVTTLTSSTNPSTFGQAVTFTAAVSRSGTPVSFAPVTQYPAGPNPQAAAGADFNGDGIIDVATVNMDNNTVTMQRGNGTGGFFAPTIAAAFPANSVNASITAADFNKDSKLDLALSRASSGGITILTGLGNGFFLSPGNTIGAGSSLTGLASGDFNGDGNPDLAAVKFFNIISIFLGNGAGGFSAAPEIPGCCTGGSIAVGDFNGDGRADLAARSGILLGDGTGAFGAVVPYPGGALSPAIVAADLNGDGKLDVAGTRWSPDVVIVQLGNGAGGFSAPTTYTGFGQPGSLAVVDFNNDGSLDLAAGNRQFGTVSVLIGNGAGSFAAATNFSVVGSPSAVIPGDLNGDGRLDIAAALLSHNTVGALLNTTPAVNEGSVTFKDGETTLGPSVPVNSLGRATFTTATLDIATHTITAQYSSPLNFSPSAATLRQVVMPPPLPTASFTANPNPAACRQTVVFNGTLSHAAAGFSLVSYEWSFGDNTTATGPTAIHDYSAFGAYSATLTVTDNNTPPNTDVSTMVINVDQGNHAPVASHGGPYIVDLGSPALLDGTGSFDPDASCGDSIVSYSWSINNGAVTLNGASPALSAAQVDALGVGTFPVSLTVTDEFNATSTASTTLSIYNNVPTASFTAAPNPAACGQTVTFDGSSSSAGRPDRAIVSYAWDFGDNTTGTGATATHAYAAFGAYSATLTVTDNNVPARTAAKTLVVTVNQGNVAPLAHAGGPYTVSSGSTVQLNGTLSSDPNSGCGDQIVAYDWDIDGIYQLSGATPTLNTAANPLSPGNHNVTLTVRDSFGAMAASSTTINVQRVLVSIAVTPTPVTLRSGQQQMFTATGTFSDGSTEVLMSGGGGGGGSGPPSFGPNDPSWQVQFPQLADFSVCSTPQFPLTPGAGSWSSQNLLTQNGNVDMVWSAGTPVVEVNGTVTLTDVVLTLSCTNGAASGTIDAQWTGTRYEGRLFFNNGATQSGVSITGWSRKAPMPMARFGLTALADGGKVYAIGGTAGACNGLNPCPFAPLNTVDAYDPSSNSWDSASPLNHGREGARAIVLGNKWYVIGGHTPGGQASGIVEVLDPAGSNTWSVLASDPMPTVRANFALVTDGSYLYAIGGDTTPANGGQVATVERFDPAAPGGERWTSLAPLPVAGNLIGAGVLNGTIVVAGAGGTNRTDLYDIAGNAWSSGAPMPAQRVGMAAAVANGGLWLIGGTTNGALNYDTWVYYPATAMRPEGWAGVGSMPTGRTTPAAAVIGDVIYAVGGADGSNIALGSNEALSTPPFDSLSTGGGPSGGSGNNIPTVQWDSTNPAVAMVDGSGNATAIGAGQTEIVARAGNISCAAADNKCATLTVVNTVPAVQIFGGPFTTNESANFQNFSTGGNFTDPDQQSWTATVDYGDGTGPQPLALSNLQNGFTPTGQFNLSHQYADNGVFTVTVTLDDHAGGIGIATKQVTVNNVAPQVFGPQSASTNAGSSMNFGCISFSDVPADAPWTATVDYGDGSGAQVVTPNVPGSCGGGGTTAGAFSLSHAYSSSGNFTVSASVTDKDGATGMRSFPIAVNAAPAVTIDNTPLAAINEGSTFSGTASFTDAMGDGPWTVRISYGDNTGQFQSTVASLGSIPLNHVYRDNGSYAMSVQVQDKFFLTGTATATLTVNNVAPTVNTLPSLNAITEGQPVGFNVTFTDPGVNDTQMPGAKALINWGDGATTTMNVFTNNGTGNFFVNHTYRDNPAAPDTAFTITVTVSDKDGATSAAQTAQLVVNNAPPSVQLNYFPDLVQGGPATFTGQLLDQGALDAPWSGEVDFGDSVVQPFSFALNAQGQTPRGTFSVTHTYQQSGPVTLTFRATDKDGATGTRTFQLDINPVMVSVAVSPTAAWLNAVGQTLQFNASALFSDGSTHYTNGNVIPGVTWSSANHAVAMISASGLATAMGPGITTITVNVEDDFGHQFAAQATLRVDVTPPVITANDITAEATSSSGAAVTLVFSATDDFDSNPSVVADRNSGVFPHGTTNVIVTATDAAGNTSTRTMRVIVVDTTAPVLSLPGSITVDATSPEGAIVHYSASATDVVGGNITVICAPPTGSTFPIGTTEVPCTATDAAGNTAAGSFTVLVQAAAAQVSQLSVTVQSFNLQQGIANSLDAKLDMVLNALNGATSGDTNTVCNRLGAFINETTAQSGKRLTVAQANQLIASAQQIQAVIGCQ